MKLHPRRAQVVEAELAMSKAVNDVMAGHDVTPIEMIGILTSLLAQQQKYALRYERHGNYNKKADEE